MLIEKMSFFFQNTCIYKIIKKLKKLKNQHLSKYTHIIIQFKTYISFGLIYWRIFFSRSEKKFYYRIKLLHIASEVVQPGHHLKPLRLT